MPVELTRDQLSNGFNPRMIERAVNVVDGVPNNQTQLLKRSAIMEFIPHNVFSSLSIFLDCRSVSVRHPANSAVKIRDVLVGPIKL